MIINMITIMMIKLIVFVCEIQLYHRLYTYIYIYMSLSLYIYIYIYTYTYVRILTYATC